MEKLFWVVIVAVLSSFVISCGGEPEGDENPTSPDALSQDTDRAGNDACQNGYGEVTASYLGYDAHSNGSSTGSINGAHQCARFVQEFYSVTLGPKPALSKSWGTAGNAINAILSPPADSNWSGRIVYVIDPNVIGQMYPNLSPSETARLTAPRPTDIIIHDSAASGHAVIARDGISSSGSDLSVPVIEENYVDAKNCGNPRKLNASRDAQGVYRVDSGFRSGYSYKGLIRHNLAGAFSDCGFHKRTGCESRATESGAFFAAWDGERTDNDGKSLGFAFDNGGGPFVHDVNGLLVQDFWNPIKSEAFGTDGQTAIVYNAAQQKAYVLKEGFWGAYKCLPSSYGGMGGTTMLGAPIESEHPDKLGTECQPDPNGLQVDAFQRFENGCMWWRQGDDAVHIHIVGATIDSAQMAACGLTAENNEPWPTSCSDECSSGERSCSPSGKPRVCGNPDSDHCYEWIEMNCAAGLTCEAGACVTPGSSTQVDDSESQQDSSAVDDVQIIDTNEVCTEGERRCDGVHTYAVCERHGGYPGILAWEAWPCPPEWDCDATAGECNIPVVSDNVSYCGDGTCDGDESCGSCAADCGECAPQEPVCGDGDCAADESCEDCPNDCGECQTELVPPEEVEQRPQQTVYCERAANGLSVTITGPMLDGMALMQTPDNPTDVMLGANGYGWPSQSQSVPWLGDDVAHVLTVPSDVTSFNVYVGDDDTDGDFWLRLAPNAGARWQAYGACRNGRYEIEVLASGTEGLPDDGQTIESEPEPEPAPYCGDGRCDADESCESCASDCGVCAEPDPYCGDGSCNSGETCSGCSSDCGACPEQEPQADDSATHVISCELTSSWLIVTVTGPLLDRNALMEIPTDPTQLVVGSDTGGWPTRGVANSLDNLPQAAWSGDTETHVLNLPVSTDRFNIYLADAADPYRDSWLRLKESDGSPWAVVGDCVMGVGVILQD